MRLFCSFFISFILTVTTEYVDNFSRNVMYPLAAGAMLRDPGVCMKKAAPDAMVRRWIEVPCDVLNETCAGYSGYIPSQNAIVLSFRGTDGSYELQLETLEILLGPQQTFPGGSKVANFFYLGFLKIWNAGMKDDFLSLRQQYPSYDIWITGHSLGASMAGLCAGYIVQLGLTTGDKVKLYTFGEPRTGDSDYAALINSLIPTRYRVVHANDWVPHMPFTFENYEHHANEIWYNNDMKVGDPFKVCTGNEDPQCSASVPSDQWNQGAHGFYYDTDINQYQDRGCVFINQDDKDSKLVSKNSLFSLAMLIPLAAQ